MAANDGVGTKVKIAIETGIHGTVGIDLVAMSVNDLVVQGAEPLFFLDYFATGKLTPKVGAAIVAGIADGCQAGRLRADRRRDRRDAGRLSRQRLRSRGLCGRRGGAQGRAAAARHQGGRRDPRHRVVGRAFQRLLAGPPGGGEVELKVERGGAVRQEESSVPRCSTPTRIYVKPLLAAIRETKAVKALAHITGGGFPDNIPRVLPKGTGARIDLDSIKVRRCSAGSPKSAASPRSEMLRTFNCGIGMIAVVEPRKADAVIEGAEARAARR